MSSNVTSFPTQRQPALLVGPFEYHKVVVDGRAIPRLTGWPQADGRVTLILDGRFAVDYPDEEAARQSAWLIANALAIGAGYSHVGAESRDMPFAPQIAEISPDQPA